MSIETLITLFILVIIAIAIIWIVSVWVYKRAPANRGFIRTGLGGTKVCLGKGALVLPVFHEVTWISLETIKLIVSRARDQAILTSDKIRIDIIAELYTHVGHTPEDLLTASRSLGEKTFDPDSVRDLLEAKIVSALRSYAATKTLSELHENRDMFSKDIKNQVLESFGTNGLILQEVTIVTLEQTGKEYFKSDNVFDAEGLKIITEITSDAKRKVHDTEKRTSVAIRQKDLDTQLELLEIERQEAFAKAGQDKDVSNEQALQVGAKQRYVLDQKLAVEQKEIENEQFLEQRRTERDISVIDEARKRELSEIEKTRIIEEQRRDREIILIAKAKEEELASIQKKLALEKAEKDRSIDLLEKSNQEELAQIKHDLSLDEARKNKEVELISYERERQEAEIQRQTVIA
ncbi:MAG: SPFH domain-containing protein, partial [Nitrospinaceae bacterium]|nr:SPFH domain-containing protein [Nitrospinaceae bacterium]